MWKHPSLSKSSTKDVRFWSKAMGMDANVWAKLQLLDSQEQEDINTVVLQLTRKAFSKDPVWCFVKVDKTSIDIFGIFQQKSKFVFCATARTNSALVLRLSFSYLHFSWEAKEMSQLVSAFSTVLILVYEDDHPKWSIFQCPSGFSCYLKQSSP